MRTREELILYLQEHNAFADESKTKLNSGITRYVNNRPELLKELKEITKVDSGNVAELIYNLVNPQSIKVCEVCGKPTEFSKYYLGYKKACCEECAKSLTIHKGASTKIEKYGNISYNNKEKAKQTCIDRYGKTSYTNREKAKQTCIDKYGVENVSQLREVANKIKQTCIDKYGIENVSKVDSIKEKVRSTNLERYGVEFVSQSEKIKEKQRESSFKKNFEEIVKGKYPDMIPLFTLNDYKGVKNFRYNFKCKKCGNEFEANIDNGNIPICRVCHSYENSESTSQEEKEVLSFVRSIYKGNLIENDRSILNGKELDIYIPEKKLAIEFDGLFWHSESQGKDSHYHANKTSLCKEKGIRLIHIFEDDWLYKRIIIESIIKDTLGIYDKQIDAKECQIKNVSCKEAEIFLNQNHLQGYVQANINSGLFHKGELVSLLAIGVPQYNCNYDWEIIRFCDKLEYEIFGSFKRLFEHLNISGKILTYSDASIFTGNTYRNSGFVEL